MSGDRLRALLGGSEMEQVSSTSDVASVMRHWIPLIREGFERFVIRRTLNSVDCDGKPIFGLPPYRNHVFLVELRDWEKERLQYITDDLLEQGPAMTLAGVGKVRASYLVHH
ncbi:hypothetical protein JVT61DRAFT_9130 [Boletus reticuloceps]|uniref:Uncharacterized protein n=1 Tax=Boletus reticuloceps TaxID=495285 RepID=A0A8I2YH54_9AGAM|nr:hypothetical protein JVT61DRAFT_9130 [Boletus reticuloceps]